MPDQAEDYLLVSRAEGFLSFGQMAPAAAAVSRVRRAPLGRPRKYDQRRKSFSSTRGSGAIPNSRERLDRAVKTPYALHKIKRVETGILGIKSIMIWH
jgi:hypothetical protein